MKIKELFNSNYTVAWDKVGRLPFMVNMTANSHSIKWHKCGSAWTHTMIVSRIMEILLVNENIQRGSRKWYVLMSAALLHDIGKPQSTYWDISKQDYTCPNHGTKAAELIREYFSEETDKEMLEDILWLVGRHMNFHFTTEGKEKESVIRGLSEEMFLLNLADTFGSINEVESVTDVLVDKKELRERLKKLREGE